MDEILLIFYLWPARSRARAVALAEALSLLGDLHARASEKGPLSEQGGLFWILLPAENLEAARVRLARSGYTAAVDWLEPVSEPVGHKKRVRGAHLNAVRPQNSCESYRAESALAKNIVLIVVCWRGLDTVRFPSDFFNRKLHNNRPKF